MERSGNFYKAIRLGYILISILIGCMAYNSLYEWQEIEALELGNKKIDELRKEINNINIQMIKFSLLGETILEWNDKDIEHYHARRMAMDSMLCRFKATYPAERIDSVRSLLEDKERQMFQIVRLMDEQQSINKKIANQIPVIVQKSVQEQSKKPKRKGFLGIFGKKKEVTPAVSTTILHSVNRNVISEQKVQDRQLSEQADSLAARNAELNRQLQELICQIEEKVQTELQSRENEIVAMREKSFMQVGGLMGFVLLLLLISYIIIHRDAKSIKQYKHKTTDLIRQLEQSVQRNEALITSRKKAVHTITHELRTPLTEAQRLKRQKMIVLPAMVLVFIGAMWLIFAPSSGKEQPPGTDGYNTEMPDADKANRQIIGDKLKAYEHGEMEERQESRNRAIGQLGDMFDREIAGTENGVDFDLANPGGKEERAKPATPQTIQSSAAAYRDLNATLGNFYDQPKNDNAEMDELLERIASLESELESERGKASSMDEQVALMEKSYELAAKYMGGQNGGQPSAEQRAEPTTVQKGKKNKAMPIRQVEHQVVSSLSQPMSNAEFVAALSQERNRGFNTAVGTAEVLDRNTIPACVHGAQSVTDGQTVRLRLLEPMAVAGRTIPRGAVVVGTGKIQGERLDIEITSLEYDGTIIPVELAVYDTDGQPGIFIPNSMEMNAVREVAANMGGSLGSSINISTNAGAQLASDLGKGLIQGTSQYIAKKMRTVKVHLKAGYRVMLYQEKY